jgi:glutaredoxin-like protein NrdH
LKTRTITVYTTPGCVQCKPTKRWLDKKHIPYREVDITLPENEADAKAIKELGFTQAPVVIVSTGDPETDLMWSGFHPGNLDKYTHSTEEAA